MTTLGDRPRETKSYSLGLSTFIKIKNSVRSITERMLHSKSTYFYRWFPSETLHFGSSYAVPSFCILALLFGLSFALNPLTKPDTFALDSDTTNNTEENIYNPAISLNLTQGNADQVTTALSNSVTYRANQFSVSAQDVDGYKIYIQAAEGYSGELKGLANPEVSISGVGTNIAPEYFVNNTWGYAIKPIATDETVDMKSLRYSSIPDHGEAETHPAYTTTSSEENKEFFLAFAAKLGDDIPSDHYRTKVMISIAASAKQVVSGFNGIYTMQDMTTTICRNAPANSTGRLRDIRDNKIYWVAKLADDNCWMTQNLDLDLDSQTILTPDTTDIADNWLPDKSTLHGSTTGWNDDYTSDELAQSYDPGLFVYATPTTTNPCEFKSDNSTTWPTSLAECVEQHNWIDVANINGMPYSPSTEIMNANGSDSITVIDHEKKLYDAHYLIGNYYSFKAATAGTVLSSNSQDAIAQGSICPAGWQLPLSGAGTNASSHNNTKGSFYYLLKQHGFSSGVIGNNNTDIRGAPLYFTYGGFVDVNLYYAGRYGRYWSRVVHTLWTTGHKDAWDFMLYDTSVKPSDQSGDFTNGYQVRCLAR